MLCASGVPTWVVHERRTVEACPTIKSVTIPGSVFVLPNEVPDQIATVINQAVAAVETRRTPAQATET